MVSQQGLQCGPREGIPVNFHFGALWTSIAWLKVGSCPEQNSPGAGMDPPVGAGNI